MIENHHREDAKRLPAGIRSELNLLPCAGMMSSWLDGLDMSKTLKDDVQFRDMSILMLTGVKEKTMFDFKPKTGGPNWCSADANLDKPVEPDVLLAEVERLLSKKPI
ncbi:MAG: hypothetical protein JSW59_16820 [Phycisphaerales bacterium]|nr:MAG: hypothetical protein JSW59_16820 [Phycisphaerales bacterium]